MLIRRIALASSLLVVLLLVTVAAFYFVSNRSGRAAWQSYAEGARARGVKLMPEDYIPPPVPDAENFASVPLFAELFSSPEAGEAKKGVFKLPEIRKRGAMPAPEIGTPADLSLWRDVFAKQRWLPPGAPDAPADAVLAALDHRFAKEWAQLREAAARPESRFPVQWEKNFAAKLPHVTVVMDASRVNALRLEAHVVRGERREASEDVRLALRLARSMEREPTLISGIVFTAVLHQALTGIWSSLAAEAWDDATLREIDMELSRFDLLEHCAFSFNSERANMNALFHQLIDDPAALRSTEHISSGNPMPRGAMRIYPTGWLHDSRVRANRVTDEILARIDRERELYTPIPLQSLPDKMLPGFLERSRYLLFYLIVPGYTHAEAAWLHAHTRVQQARVACALERHRLARGNYPVTLDGLVPDFLPNVPRDIMDGAPLRYRRDETARFAIYSLAMNRKDDGGITTKDPEKQDKGISAQKQLDWVWAYPAAPAAP